MDDYDFYAETPSGYTIKILSEILYNCLSDEFFLSLKKTGISSSSKDNRKTTLLMIDLKMENFDNYKCVADKTIAINLKHLQKLLKSIKKKDSITLFIRQNTPNKLGIRIVPTVGTKKSDRIATDYISIREVVIMDHETIDGYDFPKVIGSSDYQKMCKKMIVVPGKIMNIKIQKSNYVSFFCDGGEIMSSELEFGTFDVNEPKCYNDVFYIDTITQLIKIPGLSPKIQIYAPNDDKYPIKFKIQAGTLGTLEIYIKNKNQIDYEETLKGL